MYVASTLVGTSNNGTSFGSMNTTSTYSNFTSLNGTSNSTGSSSSSSTFQIFAKISSTDSTSGLGVGDSFVWLDTILIILEIAVTFGYWYFVTAPADEKKRREDFRVHARAKLLHDVARGLVSNFLPAPVLKAVQDRAGNASGAALGNDSEIVAWAFDPACVLQSDICRCRTPPPLSFSSLFVLATTLYY